MFNFKDNTKFDILGFGEVMLRLSPPDKETVSRSNTFIKNAGGSELNVVSGVAMLGKRGGIITKLPDSKIGRFIRNSIRYGNVSDDFIVYDKSELKRLGIYYYENGAYPRKSSVLYDRQYTSFSNFKTDELDENVYKNTKIFHVSSISLAINNELKNTVFELVKRFKNEGTKISFDVNYRAALWSEDDAKIVVEQMLPYVDYLFVSEETSRRMLKKNGTLESIMKSYCEDFGCLLVASTKRQVVSPTRHNFTSAIYANGQILEEMPYNNIEVIDRVGSGDAYVAGVLFGMLEYKSLKKALELGNALSALKNTVAGDMACFSLDETEKVAYEHSSNGIKSELDR